MSVFRHGDGVRHKTATKWSSKNNRPSSTFATTGTCTALGDAKEVRILNRFVRWVKPPYGAGRERVEYEADPRHAELIIHQLGLSSSSRSASAPCEKSKLGVGHSTVLNSPNHTLGRYATMRMFFLRWIDLTCSSHQKHWHDGCKHQQLVTWRRSNESLDT